MTDSDLPHRDDPSEMEVLSPRLIDALAELPPEPPRSPLARTALAIAVMVAGLALLAVVMAVLGVAVALLLAL